MSQTVEKKLMSRRSAAICTLIAGNLREKRIAQGLTQSELAKLAGISRITLIRFEHQAFMSQIDTLVSLCAVLGVSLDELTGSQDPFRHLRTNKP